jgi:putative transposase
MPVHRKQTRLPAQYYVGSKSHFVTLCCDLRRTHLATPAIAEMVRDCLLDCARRYDFLVHAYCLMPDHLHMLLQGTQASADLIKFMRIFKSRTAFAFQQRDGQRLWEMSYYDHILRSSESAEQVAQYIWWNPVRKHLCTSPLDFRFSGSQTIPWKMPSVSASLWSPPWRSNRPV